MFSYGLVYNILGIKGESPGVPFDQAPSPFKLKKKSHKEKLPRIAHYSSIIMFNMSVNTQTGVI